MDFKKIVLFNPAISSFNMGDHIIADAAKNQLDFILSDAFTVEVSSHLPISRMYMRHTKDFDLRFVCGSNLLRGKMDRLFRQWDIRLDQADLIKNSILVGTGWWQYGDDTDIYTKKLYHSILSKDVIHSVRDNYTKEQLNKIGFNNVLNTACPTMWKLTPDHCNQISPQKKNNVVFTLTDYNKDVVNDKKLIDILIKNYDSVYYWIQGTKDFEYINSIIDDKNDIKFIAPTLDAFDKVLMQDDIEYVGTRLHAGIRALQKKRRSIIIGIDNRAVEKQKDFNIKVINRNELVTLEETLHENTKMEIIIPEKEIIEWKSQFK
ncbi:polysaccharide pyruvyl transferase family protein [Streptococcus uberis]|uniref:polysaccharide pyruvyl transferase family protein n=1 Tax=Streptococcus uberis TaxID=1349 RepID=UPI00193A4C84|nr:polysaccharide pyruvyl transferase family protein [Streptococcus uberis]MCK1236518.1 polysaccharide pyruvyl transferase family protein [Streptococcus uberis]